MMPAPAGTAVTRRGTMAHTRRTVAELRRAFGGRVALVRHDMGITGFGVQLFDFRPGDDGPPEHDEAASGQEELYVGLSGSGWIEVDGESLEFGPETLVAIPPGTRRKVRVGADGLRYLCVGGVPGGAYEPSEKFDRARDAAGA
jgi:mannose-6-phosphate isomerase-like protein (cupin superfamily)